MIASSFPSAELKPSETLREKSQALIPGGCHAYYKGDDLFPELAPAFIVRGKGCRVWDADGDDFTEYGMGLRAVSLGHAYDSVIEAAYRQMRLGQNFTRPSPLESECAEALCDLIASAEMCKFAKDGSTVTSAAIRLARAATGRDHIAVCADHPFFSYDDWFIAKSAMPRGVPRAVRDLTLSFRYNDLASLEALFDDHHEQIACVILEAEKYEPPADNFLHRVQALCRRHGALFILDELITGFRWHLGGAQKYYDLDPDLSTFGKALGNGFTISALTGKKHFMRLGGTRHDEERVFLLSTTHGAETSALAAACEVMRIYRNENVIDYLHLQGARLAAGIERAIGDHRLHGHFELVGKPCGLNYTTRDREGEPSLAFRTLFLQETIKRGLLLPSLVASFSHTDADIDRTISGIHEALAVYRKALDEGIEQYLIGRPIKPVFRPYA